MFQQHIQRAASRELDLFTAMKGKARPNEFIWGPILPGDAPQLRPHKALPVKGAHRHWKLKIHYPYLQIHPLMNVIQSHRILGLQCNHITWFAAVGACRKSLADERLGAVASNCYHADAPSVVQAWVGSRVNLWIGYGGVQRISGR
jgi:hypothetical protein